MVQINFARKEINCKIVYYGPGLSGKTTNLEKVHECAPENSKGELTSISTDGDRTLFFDFMPLDLGSVAGMRTKFHIYTVPGQVYYNSTRKLVLLGADGIIFVADSSPGTMEANKQSLDNLRENLLEMGKDIAKVPLVMQWNKRDMPEATSVEEMESELNIYKVPAFEACASTGEGVIQTLKGISGLVLESINSNERAGTMGQAAPGGLGAAPAPAAPAPAAPTPAPAQQPAAAGGGDLSSEIERNHVPGAQPIGQPAAPAQTEGVAAAAQQQNVAVDGPAGPGTQPAAGPSTATLDRPEPVATVPQAQTEPPPQAAPGQKPQPAPAARPGPAQKAVQQEKVNQAVRDKIADSRPQREPQQARQMQVIGGKPKGKGKKSNAVGIIIAIVVVLLLAGAGVAYYMMM
jgi:signal recognition particle receptor subunit beta